MIGNEWDALPTNWQAQLWHLLDLDRPVRANEVRAIELLVKAAIEEAKN